MCRRREQCRLREQGPGQFTHPRGALIRSGKNPHSDDIIYTILCNKHRGPTIFDDMHRPTILGSNEVPSKTNINPTFVDTDEDYNIHTNII